MHIGGDRRRCGGPGRARRLALTGAMVLGTVATTMLVVVSNAPSAGAATITVTTTTDGGGGGSLRSAIAAASASTTPTTISLAADQTYNLTVCDDFTVFHLDSNNEGDLDYTGIQPLTIEGHGATIHQTCTGNSSERIIEATAGPLVVHDATFTGGHAILWLYGLAYGGAILANDVELDDVTVTGNRADNSGGGVAAMQSGIVRRSTISGNQTQGVGDITIEGSAGDGGGLYGHQLTIDKSTITGNSSAFNGGGIAAYRTLHLTDSTVADNTALYGAGGILGADADVTVDGSTINGNGREGLYLGSSNPAKSATVTRSTIAGNAGAGVTVDDRTNLSLSFVTLGDNGLGDLSVTEAGGQLSVSVFASVFDATEGGPGCVLHGNPVTSTGYAYDDDGSCGFGGGAGDVSDGADPQLEPLADNGGPTPTRMPAAASALVDRIPASVVGCTGSDQRGAVRPQTGACDIGAVEVGSGPPFVLPGGPFTAPNGDEGQLNGGSSSRSAQAVPRSRSARSTAPSPTVGFPAAPVAAAVTAAPRLAG